MRKYIGFAAALGVVALAWPTSEARADAYGCKESAKYCMVSEYCKTANAVCGGIAYINKGGYAVNPTRLDALGSQPSDKATINANCSSVSFKTTADVDLGQYLQYVVPADCAYKLKIKILAGKTKDRNLFLTPGCVIEAKTDGTTLNNEWHISVSWSDKAKSKGYTGTVQDQAGNKCGNLDKM